MASIQDHLTNIASKDETPEQHKNYLRSLKASGFEPRVIYDIGACVCHWCNFAKTLWPDAHFILFDAFDKAEFLYQGYDYHVGVLGNEDDKVVRFFQNDMFPTGNSYYREVGSDTVVFPEEVYRECVMSTLSKVVKTRQFPLPDLVKIDVQGAERDVIMGGVDIMKNARHLIVEMQHTNYNDGAPKAVETLPYIESLGFKCVAPLFCNNGPDGDYGFIRVDAYTHASEFWNTQKHLSI